MYVVLIRGLEMRQSKGKDGLKWCKTVLQT